MIQTASAMAIRQNLGELLNEVRYHHTSIIITKADKPVAALIDIALFERIRQMKARFTELSSELARAYAKSERAGAEADIAEAVKAVRQ